MPELEPFDTRLEAAVHAFADRAQTSVDAAATAEQAMRHRPRSRLAWLGIAVPVPVSILFVLALLVLALALSLGIGAPRRGQDAAIPIVAVSPVAASPRGSTTPDPGTDGRGDEIVAGTAILALTTPYAESRAGANTRLRDGVITVTTRMSDPRVSGTGTWQVSADLSPTTGPRWGAYRLENAAGAWDGTCSGAAWDAGSGGVWSCRLTGSGAYDGYSYLSWATTGDSGIDDVRGVIYPGPPPAP
jgi:hypothetical protein